MSENIHKKNQFNRLALLFGGFFIILLVAAGIYFLKPDEAQIQSLTKEISTSDAALLRDQGAFILDVREPEEWDEYHIPESTLIPLAQLESRINEIPGDQPIVVVCRSGNRSAVGRDMLLNAGFSQVTSLAGGISTWRSEGYPVESAP